MSVASQSPKAGNPFDTRAANMQRLSLSEQALRVIRQAMVSGEIRPGEIYSAAALAAQLGVSNSPVREAMLTLVNEGLMVPVRNRGYQVVHITAEEIQDIHDIRLMLEIPAMTEIAQRAAEFDLDSFQNIAKRIIQAAEKSDITGYLENDRDFHVGLIDLIGNPRLTKLVENLRDQTRLYGLHGLNGDQLVTSANEHLEIVSALRSGDETETQRVMTKHLGHILHEWASPE